MIEEPQKKIDIDYYIKLILKRRWFILIPFCISLCIGIYLSVTLPKVYSANNLILVVPKSVPDKYVPSVTETDVQQRINTIKQQILSRTNIEKIIDKFQLFSGPEYNNMYLVDKISKVRKSASVKVTKSRRGIDSFVIEFKGGNPQKVMDVVNTLSESFINESIKIMADEVIETNKFLEGELAFLREKLKEIEEAIKDYRKEYMGELPEELESNLKTIERFQLQLNEKQENIRSGKNRLSEIEAQIAIARANAMSLSSAISASRPGAPPGPTPAPISELDKLNLELKALKLRYTDRHPDIIRLKEAIALLEEKKKMEEADRKEAKEEDETDIENLISDETGPEKLMDFDPAALLRTQYEEIKEDIKIYNEDILKINALIDEYQKRVENTPKREQALLDLNRNYENIRRSYNNLLDRKLASDIAVNMEKKQKGQKFRVIDTAKLPQKPVSPDMKKLFAAFSVLGLGIGLGVIFLLDYMDNSLKKPGDIEEITDIPLLATIPEIHMRSDRIKYKINSAASIFTAMISFVLFSVFALFALKGVDKTIGFIKKIL